MEERGWGGAWQAYKAKDDKGGLEGAREKHLGKSERGGERIGGC